MKLTVLFSDPSTKSHRGMIKQRYAKNRLKTMGSLSMSSVSLTTEAKRLYFHNPRIDRTLALDGVSSKLPLSLPSTIRFTTFTLIIDAGAKFLKSVYEG